MQFFAQDFQQQVIEKGHPEEWPLILPQVIHHKKAVKKDGEGKDPEVTLSFRHLSCYVT